MTVAVTVLKPRVGTDDNGALLSTMIAIRQMDRSSGTSLVTVTVKVLKPRVGTDDNGELLSTA